MVALWIVSSLVRRSALGTPTDPRSAHVASDDPVLDVIEGRRPCRPGDTDRYPRHEPGSRLHDPDFPEFVRWHMKRLF